MESHSCMKCGCDTSVTDYGPAPLAVNVTCAAGKNQNFRTAFWTGCHLQMTLMNIPACCEIGLEMHPDTDQFIRVESGQAFVCAGTCKGKLDFQCCLNTGDGIFVPAGTWHNVRNTGNCPLKLSSIYAPLHHPKGTVHRAKADSTQKD